ncbi:SPOR domain-containing protein [Helicobacter pametensis]|uniref:SPOR domain-containing protein n=1 Tax=Helicobacter pametensis TaxID=95149 RepID=UPI00047F7D60|nr:SPOR domain-containing protein [Helicobacter pametensis]
MENNLDDILVDSPEQPVDKDQSKRKILIAIASVLLIATVGIVAYFILAKPEKPKGLEVTHAELEKFVNPDQAQTPKSQVDEEFDKLIAEIKSKHESPDDQLAQPQVIKKSEPSQQPSQTAKEPTTPIQALQKINVDPTQSKDSQSNAEQNTPKPETTPKASVDKDQMSKLKKSTTPVSKPEPKSEPKPVSPKVTTPKSEISKPTAPKAKQVTSTAPKSQTAIQTFGSIQKKIPNGFYLQVGVFGSKPNAEFMKKLSGFAYQVQKMDQNGRVVNRYLIGPFKSRAEAQAKVSEVASKVAKPLIVEIR